MVTICAMRYTAEDKLASGIQTVYLIELKFKIDIFEVIVFQTKIKTPFRKIGWQRPSAFFPATTILWALSFCVRCIGHYAPKYEQDAMHHAIRPFYKVRTPVRLRLPVTQASTKSLRTLLVLHAKTFELTKPSIMQVIILK